MRGAGHVAWMGRSARRVLVVKPETYCMKDLHTDGRIILKWDLKKYD
jgi:hypothetical protein